MVVSCCSASSLHLHRPGSLPIKQPAAQWAKLSSLINAVEIISHGHVHKSISQVSLDSVKLTPASTVTSSFHDVLP